MAHLSEQELHKLKILQAGFMKFQSKHPTPSAMALSDFLKAKLSLFGLSDFFHHLEISEGGGQIKMRRPNSSGSFTEVVLACGPDTTISIQEVWEGVTKG